MNGPDLLERVRMCLAEVGVDPSLVSADRYDPEAIYFDPRLTSRMMWKALRIAKRNAAPCLACCDVARFLADDQFYAVTDACGAYLPGTEDCRIDRDERRTP